MASAEYISDIDYRSLAEFRYQIRRFLHFSERAARDAGLEPQQHQLMLALRGWPDSEQPPSIRLLAEQLQLEHNTLVGLVDRLVERGMVTRSRALGDRRQVLVRLTERGEAELEKLAIHHLTELRGNGPKLVRALEDLTRRSNGSE